MRDTVADWLKQLGRGSRLVGAIGSWYLIGLSSLVMVRAIGP